MAEEKKKKSLLKRWWFWLVIIVIAGAVFGTGGGDDDTPTVVRNENTGSDATEAEVVPPGVGDIVQLRDSDWVITEAEDLGSGLSSNDLFNDDITTSGKYIQIAFTVKNTSNETISFNPLIDRHHPKLKDSAGREYEYIDSMYAYIPEGGVVTDNLAENLSISPGIEKSYYAIYEVPSDAADFYITVRPLSSGQGMDIYLGF